MPRADLDYMIDPTFRKINRLFVVSFKNGDNDPTRDYFDKYYMSLVEIKDFDVFIYNKPFFDQHIKRKQETYEKLVEMSRNDDYTTGNLLGFLYYRNYYKLIDIDLSRQTNTSILQQINFTGKIEEDNGVTMFLQQITILNFSLNSIIITGDISNGTSKNIESTEGIKRS